MRKRAGFRAGFLDRFDREIAAIGLHVPDIGIQQMDGDGGAP
jgi:hypothetical protein